MNSGDLQLLMQQLYRETDDELMDNYQRSLSFQDGLFDRWERAKRLGFGKNASIYNSSLVYGDVKVGSNTWIGPNTILDGSGDLLSIGVYCSISAGVQIYTHDTILWALSGGRKGCRSGLVSIGNKTYIGSQCIIASNVSIGNMVVVAANSFVNKDVKDREIVAGTPARVIGKVVGEHDDVKLIYGDNCN